MRQLSLQHGDLAFDHLLLRLLLIRQLIVVTQAVKLILQRNNLLGDAGDLRS
ncbi:hypothetical protein ACZ87_02591 [Candidatus Erwinia dacicola]|uniref:Uncharacterized protein n=1 Tax=Candidatus Erwinia dacicola TaxID=252393 RepID=A0A328TNQ4_9GAMM|nr:hypothetical protein ACZ87_02591 [Candidatus Erwinia dacicola]